MNISPNAFHQLQIGGYVNLQCEEYGIDSYTHCFNKLHFKKFPHQVSYQFNELGYRETSIQNYSTNPILTIGDSFTVGLGLPVELTYPKQLEKLLGIQVLNFSLNGGSNDWINRKLPIILKHITPKAIIIHYTFTHRRENNNSDWFDDERTLSPTDSDPEQDKLNWYSNHQQIKNLLHNIPTIYSSIPHWHHDRSLDQFVLIPKMLDLARDGMHYGEKTSFEFASKLVESLQSIKIF